MALLSRERVLVTGGAGLIGSNLGRRGGDQVPPRPLSGQENSVRARISVLFRPLAAIISYIIITLLINLLGPWEYAGFRTGEVVAFLALCLGVVAVGYKTGIASRVKRSAHRINKKRVFSYYSVAIILVIIVKVVLLGTNLQRAPISSPVAALLDVGNTYKTVIEDQRLLGYGEVSLIGQVDTLMGLGTLFVIVLGLYYFRELPKLSKYLFALLIFVIVSSFLLLRGTQIVFGKLFIYWLSVEAVVRLRYGYTLLNRKTVLASLAILVIFMFIQASRMDAYDVDANSLSTNPLLRLDTGHVLFRVLGLRTALGVSLIFGYLSMGYYGLSLSFAEPFVWTYGLGSSFALSGYAEQYLKLAPQLNFSYPFRVELSTGWPALMYWQTAFPWIASDLSYPGTVICLGVLAYVYARAFREALFHHNLLSLVFFANLNIFWLFLPANNQLMQERESAIATILLTILWLLFHNRFNAPSTEDRTAGITAVRTGPASTRIRRVQRRLVVSFRGNRTR